MPRKILFTCLNICFLAIASMGVPVYPATASPSEPAPAAATLDSRKQHSPYVPEGYGCIWQEEFDGVNCNENGCELDPAFWQFQNLIFLDARRLQRSKQEILRNARRAGVRDISAFEKCLDSGKYQKRVQNDFEEGISLGIQGTPTFIIGTYNQSSDTINGEMFSGAVDSSKFIRLIEKYLNHSEE